MTFLKLLGQLFKFSFCPFSFNNQVEQAQPFTHKYMINKQITTLKKENDKLKYQVKEFQQGAKSVAQIDFAKGIKKKLVKKATSSEVHMIRLLSENQTTFEFQKVIYIDTSFIVLDFYLKDRKIVIELDGGQHFKDANVAIDKNRDNYLKSQGIKVLRISNSKAMSLNKDSLRKLISDFDKRYLSKKLRIFNDFEILVFGKYSGMTVSQIYLLDKSYLIWVYRSLIGKFSEAIMRKLKINEK